MGATVKKLTSSTRAVLVTVAEGIETAEQLERMRELKCRSGQGYLYSRPLPLSDLVRWLGVHAPQQRPNEAPGDRFR
ncbi:MAG: EAL domain-containing protein [Actinomycetota bacterium]|nr:EAL domain-containing protein [Actinomycetota bacterium]